MTWASLFSFLFKDDAGFVNGSPGPSTAMAGAMADAGGAAHAPVAPLVASNKLSSLLLSRAIHHPNQVARPQRGRTIVGSANVGAGPTSKLGYLVKRSPAVEPERQGHAGVGQKALSEMREQVAPRDEGWAVEIKRKAGEDEKDMENWYKRLDGIIEDEEKKKKKKGEEVEEGEGKNRFEMEELNYKFPPEPPKPPSSTEMSPLRKLVSRGMWGNLFPFHRPLQSEGQKGRMENKRPLDRRRRDLPKRDSGAARKRPNLGAFLKAEKRRRLGKEGEAKLGIEKDFYANSSRGAKESRKTTVRKLMACGEKGKVALDPTRIKQLSTVLKELGYKSGSVYLSEAKLMHIEEGGDWTALLDRTHKLCVRALNRGKGPKKKAPEIPLEVRKEAAERVAGQEGEVRFGRELFIFAMVWMLREVELVDFYTSSLLFNFPEKRVTLCWDVSKTDPSAEGIRRTLQCWCGGACSPECPFWVSWNLVSKIEAVRGTGSRLALTLRDKTPKKQQTIASWRKVFGMKVTGHSARRTGALGYIRDGWEVSQVGFLGRWKSDMILEYAREALETMPVNKNKPSHMLITAATKDSKDNVEEAFEESRRLLQKRVDAVKADMKKAKEDLSEQIKKLEERSKSSGNLPQRVRSTVGKLTHCNSSLIATAPLFTWKTRCGWYYGGSSFNFVDDEQPVDCLKCKAALEQ